MKRIKNIKLLITGVLVLLIIGSIVVYWISTTSRRTIEKQVIDMTGMSIDLKFENADVYINGIDSAYEVSKRKKLIVYVDSSYCSGCFVSHLSDYFGINDTLSAHNAELVIVLYPLQSRIDDVRVGIKKDSLPFWCIIDNEGEFKRNNYDLPDNHLFHSFLLDEHNNIILIGNPVSNPRVKDLFYKTLRKVSL